MKLFIFNKKHSSGVLSLFFSSSIKSIHPATSLPFLRRNYTATVLPCCRRRRTSSLRHPHHSHQSVQNPSQYTASRPPLPTSHAPAVYASNSEGSWSACRSYITKLNA
ncbi:hypothetical protein L6452_31316 [Arctium lappa]|uniref:Uncharacterized protein n=1 Tax=Arctium lappa TaxID=4217 RepID=A0ACB8ZJQ5_ARCLA|nr:hypothetical protein L6452_31316 [Arctium lappa]